LTVADVIRYGLASPHVSPRWDHPRHAAAGVKPDGTPAASDRADDRQNPGFLRICGLTTPMAHPLGGEKSS